MKELLFATSNRHKVDEVRKIIPPGYTIAGLHDIAWTEEIPEPFDTYRENAKAKTLYVFERTGLSCFADDSGLAIDALDGRPGVYSARYAGVKGDSDANIQKVLEEMVGVEIRSARFYSVIAFIDNDGAFSLFEGIVEGTITTSPQGHEGFGYDPIFIPAGFQQTFGELPAALKNRISHRAKSMQQFMTHLSQLH